jgi:uncharacterized protein
MVLEGTVTNVTNFGAFVDVGVHQDGLVHISALADKFVKDPRDVVKAGQVVKVKVMEVDEARKRIGLSMRMSDEPGSSERGAPKSARPERQNDGKAKSFSSKTSAQPSAQGTMGALLQAAINKK